MWWKMYPFCQWPRLPADALRQRLCLSLFFHFTLTWFGKKDVVHSDRGKKKDQKQMSKGEMIPTWHALKSTTNNARFLCKWMTFGAWSECFFLSLVIKQKGIRAQQFSSSSVGRLWFPFEITQFDNHLKRFEWIKRALLMVSQSEWDESQNLIWNYWFCHFFVYSKMLQFKRVCYFNVIFQLSGEGTPGKL